MFPESFNIDGLVHHEFVPPAQSVAVHFWVQVVARYRSEEAVRQVAGRDSGFCTEPHIACCVITQPSYSPDLAPSHFWLFPTLKMGLKGSRFTTMGNIKLHATAELRRCFGPTSKVIG
jgi:hypothetical protein